MVSREKKNSCVTSKQMTSRWRRAFIYRWINVRLEQQGLNYSGNEFLIYVGTVAVRVCVCVCVWWGVAVCSLNNFISLFSVSALSPGYVRERISRLEFSSYR